MFFSQVLAQRPTPLPRADDDMVSAAAAAVQALKVDFQCGDVRNPDLQRHYDMIEWVALDLSDEPLLTDDTLPDLQGQVCVCGCALSCLRPGALCC